MNDITWAKAVSQADHRLAIGMTDVYLGNAWDDTLDWTKCVAMDTGGSHRLDISTSVSFTFKDKGLVGRWHFDIEPYSANGKGHYEIDVPRIKRLVAILPPGIIDEFKAYLIGCSEAVTKNAEKYQETATKEYGTAAALRAAAQ